MKPEYQGHPPQELVLSGNNLLRAGEVEKAASIFQQALDSHEDQISPPVRLVAELGLGSALALGTKSQEAISHLVIAEQLALSFGEVAMRGTALKLLGGCHFELCQYKDAIPILQQALDIAVSLPDQEDQWTVESQLGLCHVQLEQPDIAKGYFEDCMRLALDNNDSRRVAA